VRASTLVASLLLLSGCTMQAAVKDPGPYVDQKRPKSIWIEQGSAVTRVDQPRLTYFGDTIIGVSDGRPVRIPLATVTHATVSKIDWQTTTLSLVALAALAAVVDVPAQFKQHTRE
jgi:hypothetical protein